MYKRHIKRILDFVLSFLAVLVLAVFFLLFALLIKADSRGPVFFRQKRVGKEKTFFTILKFRTMYADTPKDVPTHLLADPGSRITRMGRFLRATSLDELPQVFNILAGQMSIIGPRPALWNQHDLIAERDKYGVNELVPGLTGYAQVNGRDEIPIEQKAELDGFYAKHLSFGLDVKIFFWSIAAVFRGSGISEGGPKEGDNRPDDSAK
ncbi:sugar transferase [Ruminococcaceae bacterium OttesenSCG-928-I18]|nr:sugar transferase [Ruminococcaceae bacterium OttesenSCG-928-I18]